MGALVGLVFPPALIAHRGRSARRSGAFGGHLAKRSLSRSDMKDLGDLLNAGEAGLVVIGDWRLEERIDELMRKRRAARGQGAASDLDKAETEEQIGRPHVGAGVGDPRPGGRTARRRAASRSRRVNDERNRGS